MIRVTERDWGCTTLVDPKEISGIYFKPELNCTAIAFNGGESPTLAAHNTMFVRETIAEIEELIKGGKMIKQPLGDLIDFEAASAARKKQTEVLALTKEAQYNKEIYDKIIARVSHLIEFNPEEEV